MTESQVEKYLREHLKSKGWVTKEEAKKSGEHGVDIKMWHPRFRRVLMIEVKGGSGKHPHQEKHGGFYTMIGQIVSRMDIEGNQPKRARVYALAIPYAWIKTFKAKIQGMKYAWRLLRLPVYAVKDNGAVEKFPFSYFLKKEA